MSHLVVLSIVYCYNFDTNRPIFYPFVVQSLNPVEMITGPPKVGQAEDIYNIGQQNLK
jgi:hypothetical protein